MFQTYKSKHELDEELFRAYLVKNNLQPNILDTRQYYERIRNAPIRFGDDELTVKNVLFQNNHVSVMSVITVDNALVSHSNAKVKETNLNKKNHKTSCKTKKEERAYFYKSFE